MAFIVLILLKDILDLMRAYSAEEESLHLDGTCPTGIKLADRQIERLRKAAEKAEQARAKIEKRKQEWAQL